MISEQSKEKQYNIFVLISRDNNLYSILMLPSDFESSSRRHVNWKNIQQEFK